MPKQQTATSYISFSLSSKSRINLIHHIRTSPGPPIPTRLRHDHRDIVFCDPIRLFEDIDIKTRADVPRDMAVQRPHARVVGLELQHNIRRNLGGLRGLQDLDVAALRVGRIDDRAVPGTEAFVEYVDVVPVPEEVWVSMCSKEETEDHGENLHMHRMRPKLKPIVDDEADAAV